MEWQHRLFFLSVGIQRVGPVDDSGVARIYFVFLIDEAFNCERKAQTSVR